MAPRHNVLKVLIQNRIYNSMFSSVAVWSVAHLTGIKLRLEDVVIVPLVITGIYQWNRLSDYREDRINDPDDVQATVELEKEIKLFCFVSFLLSLFMATMGGQRWTLFLIVFGIVLGFLYSSPALNGRTIIRLKNIILIKNISSAFGWALGIVLYPAWHAGYDLDIRLCFAFLYMFVGVFVLELIWDIRDLKGDQEAGIRTLPAAIGVSKTKVFIHLINFFSAASILVGVFLNYLSFPWLLILFNIGIFSLWTYYLVDQLSVIREWSYHLIYVQTVFVFLIGVTARIVVS